MFAAQVLQATAYVFCADLQSVPPGGAHSVSFIDFALVQDTRPATSDWPSIAPEGPHIYARIAIRSPLISLKSETLYSSCFRAPCSAHNVHGTEFQIE